MADKRDTRESEVPTTNVKAGFPGTTLQSVHPDDPGAQPTQPPQDPDNPQAGQEGPSVSSHPGPHGLDPSAQPLPGQPIPDDATTTETVEVRSHGKETVRADAPPKKK